VKANLDTGGAELTRERDALLEQAVLGAHDVRDNVLGAHAARGPTRPDEREDAVHTDADADTRQAGRGLLAVAGGGGRERGNEVVVAPASGDGPHADGGLVDLILVVRSLLLLRVGRGWRRGVGGGGGSEGVGGVEVGRGGRGDDGLVDDAGVVVEAAREGHVERDLWGISVCALVDALRSDLVEHVVRLEQAEEDRHVSEALLRAAVRGERGVGREQLEQFRAAWLCKLARV
jgi:hypothetical protein